MWQKISENRKTLPREHLIGCQGVKMFLLQDPFWVLSQFEFSSFVTISVLSHLSFWFFLSQFVFCHNFSFVTTRVLSQFEFCPNLSLVITWVFSQFEFCHNLSFVATWVLSQVVFCHILSFWVLSHFLFLSFITIRVFDLCHNFNFWVWSQFELLSLITIWVFEFDHNLSFWVLSQFEFLSLITIRVFDFFVKDLVEKKIVLF